jgi:DNA-directed RNA polymerase subunit RPC12/RpoP
MKLISTSWSCARCGGAFIGPVPEQGLCDQCLAELQALINLAPLGAKTCPACGGPVCADCGKALIVLAPLGLAEPAGEVNGDGG